MSHLFIKALPLVASVLGRRYGIKVHIGGKTAYTDGKDIYLPSLPLESNSETIGLARGFLDHEAAHISETDTDLVKSAKLRIVEKYLWNVIEDYRVEKVFSQRYPGCQANFEWLILRFFDRDPVKRYGPEVNVLVWLSWTFRSWAVPQIEARADALGKKVEKNYPGLIDRLWPVLLSIKTDCPDTAAAIEYARTILRVIIDYHEAKYNNEPQPDTKKFSGQSSPEENQQEASTEKIALGGGEKLEGEGGEAGGAFSAEGSDAGARQKSSGRGLGNMGASRETGGLKSLLSIAPDELPDNLESMVRSSLNKHLELAKGRVVTMADAMSMYINGLTESQIIEAKKTTLLLASQLRSLLQALTLKRSTPGYYGRLETNLVHKVILGSPKVFRAKGLRQGLDVAVHLLLDASGSMKFRIELASITCYCLCEALTSVRGVNVGATAFPGYCSSKSLGATVAPILKHGDCMHRRFGLTSRGGTPLAPALWYVMGEMIILSEARKVIFIVTDGEPDSKEEAKDAVKAAKNIGIEMFGLGLGSEAIKKLLPGRSVVVDNLSELPKKLFWLLGRGLDIKLRGN
ncbi:MAG: hypothetical protein LBE31_02795 [Deltaproteobacteria bacterium]|nr:hypothetical protein [Deltaproteobacteria bacterium]